MTRIIYFLSSLLFAALLLSSCNKDADDQLSIVEAIAFAEDKSVVEPRNLPAVILDYMETHYFETFISEAYIAPKHGYEVHTVEGIREFFNLEGSRLGPEDDEFYQRFSTRRGPCAYPGRMMRPASLPQAIQDYVADEYPDQSIELAKYIGARGVYFVAIDPPIILVFNEAGAFLTSIRCMSLCPEVANGVDVGALPESITNYIRDQYNDPEILTAFRLSNGHIVIGLFVDGERIILIFDADGNFLYQRV